MADKKIETVTELRAKFAKIKLEIRAHQEKNTNAHKKLKKQIAQELTKATQAK